VLDPQRSSNPLGGDAARVAEHYDNYVQAEAERLEKFCPVEYAVTQRYLAGFVPDRSTVGEIGVAVGHYSESLARRGCRLHLVDVSGSLLRAAEKRLRAAGLASSIAGLHHASATTLPFSDLSLDALLVLGPLYHLRELEERRQAVNEAARVLKPHGIVLAAGINRLTFLRDMFRSPDPFSAKFFGSELAGAGMSFGRELASRGKFGAGQEPGPGEFVAQFLATGNLDPKHAPPIGYAHLTTVAEFRELMTAHFVELALAGVESFTGPWQDVFHSKTAEEKAGWLDIIEATGTTPEGVAYSDHFLFVGRSVEMGESAVGSRH